MTTKGNVAALWGDRDADTTLQVKRPRNHKPCTPVAQPRCGTRREHRDRRKLPGTVGLRYLELMWGRK